MVKVMKMNRLSGGSGGVLVEETGEELVVNREADGKFGPGSRANPAGRGASRKWQEQLAARDKRIAELEEKLADRGLREENKVLKVRVKELEGREEELLAEVERLGRERGAVSQHYQGPDAGSERVGFDVAELLRAGVAGEGMPALVMALAARVADQSEILSRRAERC